jgi:hypothetical protein
MQRVNRPSDYFFSLLILYFKMEREPISQNIVTSFYRYLTRPVFGDIAYDSK